MSDLNELDNELDSALVDDDELEDTPEEIVRPTAKVTLSEVEDGVPIPAVRRVSARETKYPFARMQIGQSVLVRGDKDSLARFQRAANAFARRMEITLVTRRVGTDAMRVWRVAPNAEE